MSLPHSNVAMVASDKKGPNGIDSFRFFILRRRRTPAFASIVNKETKSSTLFDKGRQFSVNVSAAIKKVNQNTKQVMKEIFRSPLALAGLVIILVLVSGSVYAVVGLPYVEIGEEWRSSGLSGEITTPKNAPPVWVNWFRESDLPPTMI